MHIYIYVYIYIYIHIFQRANLAYPIPVTWQGLEPLPLHVASGLWIALSATEDLHFSEPSVDEKIWLFHRDIWVMTGFCNNELCAFPFVGIWKFTKHQRTCQGDLSVRLMTYPPHNVLVEIGQPFILSSLELKVWF